MSDQVNPPPPPAQPVTTPTWSSPVSIVNVVSALAAAPFIIDDLLQIELGIPVIWRTRLLAVAAVIRVVLPYLQRWATVKMGKNLEAADQALASTLPIVAADPLMDAETARALRGEPGP